MLDDKRLVLRVDETQSPMVCALDEEQCELDALCDCVSKNPGLNQKQLEKKSGSAEKKLRMLLKLALDRGLLREEHGDRKTLLYYAVEKGQN